MGVLGVGSRAGGGGVGAWGGDWGGELCVGFHADVAGWRILSGDPQRLTPDPSLGQRLPKITRGREICGCWRRKMWLPLFEVGLFAFELGQLLLQPGLLFDDLAESSGLDDFP